MNCTFEEWLNSFLDDEGPDGFGTPEGDLAADIKRLREAFPKFSGVKSLFDLQRVLFAVGAFARGQGQERIAAKEAWEKYLNELSPEKRRDWVAYDRIQRRDLTRSPN